MTSQAQRKGPPVSSHLPKPPRTKGKLPEFLTPGEVKLILEAGFKWPLGRMLTRRNRLLARTMYQCGLRVPEAVSLRPQDLSQGSLMVETGERVQE